MKTKQHTVGSVTAPAALPMSCGCGIGMGLLGHAKTQEKTCKSIQQLLDELPAP